MQKKPIPVFVCPHYQLPDLAKGHIETIRGLDLFVVEWSKDAKDDKEYCEFVETVGAKELYKVDVGGPSTREMIGRIFETGGLSHFDPYEEKKAQDILDFISNNPKKYIGIALGWGAWEFAEKMFNQKKIKYEMML